MTIFFLNRTTFRAFKRIQGQVNGAASNTPAQPDKVPSAPPQGQGSAGKSTSTAAEKSAPGLSNDHDHVCLLLSCDAVAQTVNKH